MPPSLALLIWFLLLVALLFFDPARERRNSLALWIPVAWMFFVGTRMPSQWLGGDLGTLAEAYEDGNPLNRGVFFGLMLLAILVLVSRSFRWGSFVNLNFLLMAYLIFALLSTFWSDFPLVTFKRWSRDLGGYMVMLVALTDPHPLEAVGTVLRRFCYLVIPLSVLLNKYYPQLSTVYDAWTGSPMTSGATTSKNMLGVACLVAGIFFFWDIVMRWSDRAKGRTKRILLVNAAFFSMAAWLLYKANSATSSVCLAIGCFVIMVTSTKVIKHHPSLLKVLVPTSFCSYVILAYWFNANAYLVGAVGRNPTLTDRTFIWATLLNMKTNPVVGTGYRSFFLGDRLQQFWITHQGINEAHNGYLDIYLTLGLVGLVLLLGCLVGCYRTIWERFGSSRPLASLGLAIWTVLLFYNITEAAFDCGLLWLSLMLVGISAPGLTEDRSRNVSPLKIGAVGEQLAKPIREPAGFRNGLTPERPSLTAHSIHARKT